MRCIRGDKIVKLFDRPLLTTLMVITGIYHTKNINLDGIIDSHFET